MDHILVSDKLVKSIKEDRKLFPYIEGIKDFEPYRVKLRYIIEKLSTTLNHTLNILKKASGDTTRPLLSLTMPGPSGYNTAQELQHDLHVVYDSLVQHGGKSQGRSLMQDLRILVDTFGFHMCPIDFRQTSDKNSLALSEYLRAILHPVVLSTAAQPKDFSIAKMKTEAEKIELLLNLITSPETEYNPALMKNVSKTTKDTFESLLVFADAARVDPRSIGKFIISMCTAPSDILVVFALLRLTGLIHCERHFIGTVDDKKHHHQHHSDKEFEYKLHGCVDVTGLFETIYDLKVAPEIVNQVLSIPLIRNYIVEHRNHKFTVMLGYSDSVRDGSSLASDANTAKTSIEMQKLEKQLNESASKNAIELVIFRGRGDTIARGYGGDIRRSIASQAYTSKVEDHTEQNRYLRIYSSHSSALDHLHVVYAAHLTAVTRLPHAHTDRYLKYFEFFGNISTLKWSNLVRNKPDCHSNGDVYFNLLEKYSILSILPTCCFASRPVCREASGLDIENIRAIPFTMALSQLREFTNAYYGAGTSFAKGTLMLQNLEQTASSLFAIYVQVLKDEKTALEALTAASKSTLGLAVLVNKLVAQEKLSSVEEWVEKKAKKNCLPLELHETLEQVVHMYPQVETGIHTVAFLLHDLHHVQQETLLKQQQHQQQQQQQLALPLLMLQEMYNSYGPFRYSVDNKETTLMIRDYKIVCEYCKDATPAEKALLQDSEDEAQLTRDWILKINRRASMQVHSMKKDFNSSELYILHKIQARFLRNYRALTGKSSGSWSSSKSRELTLLTVFCQMSILAISEGIGFGG